jgi:magnesium-transporting ATPase (P-type)
MGPFGLPPWERQLPTRPRSSKFVPFDPGTKMSEATVQDPGGGTQRVVKGAFAAVIGLTQPSPTATAASEEARGERLQGAGGRGRTAECDEAGRAHRAQRPASQGLGGARYRIARTRRTHRYGHG